MHTTLHIGSDMELDPLNVIEKRESDHCQSIGVPFLAQTRENGVHVWAYLWEAENILEGDAASTKDPNAPYFILLVAQCPFTGTKDKAVLPYRLPFKEWARSLSYAAERWNYRESVVGEELCAA